MNLVDNKTALKTLKSGLPIIFPTDTLPAIGCLPKFSNIIYEFKKRDRDKPLILMGSENKQLIDYVHESAKEDYENNNFKTGFPDFQEYLDSLFGYEYSPKNYEEYDNEQFEDESINTNNDGFNNYEYPTTSPEEPPPVKLHQDIETVIELTPDEALNGASILIELEDETVVEVDTPPFAGDGWRLRLENIARGGKDHYLQLKVQTESGLRIDGLRVLYKLELFPHDALLGCAVEVPTLDGNVTLQVPPKSSTGRMLRLKGRGLTFEDNVGDQYVEILVVIPADINDEEIALYTRLQELSLSDS